MHATYAPPSTEQVDEASGSPLKLIEAEVKGNVDLSLFAKPAILENLPKSDGFDD